MDHYAKASRATIAWDEPTEAWRLEVWDDGNTALGLWPLTKLNDLDAAAYATVRELLDNIGLADEGRALWVNDEGVWRSFVARRVAA